jgi:transposase
LAVRRFETSPGKQAQVDWGHLGTLEMAGQEQKLHGFTFTLGYSRRMVAEAALDQKLGTLLRLHEAAFQQIGGVPEEILYDRMKTVWLGHHARSGSHDFLPIGERTVRTREYHPEPRTRAMRTGDQSSAIRSSPQRFWIGCCIT